MSTVDIEFILKKLLSKYQVPFGIAVWGFKQDGSAKEILVDDEGKLVISGDVSASVTFPQWQTDSTKTTDDIYGKLEDILSKLSSIEGSVSVDNFPSWFTSSTKTMDDLYSKLSSISGSVSVSNMPTDYATESTLSDIKSKTDKLSFDVENNLYVNLAMDSVGLAKDSTVSGLMGNDGRTLTDIYDKLSNVGGSVSVSNFPTDYAKESQLPSSLTSSGNLKVAIEEDAVGLATETTLSGIKSQTDKLTFDSNSYLYVNIGSDSSGILKKSDLSFDSNGYLNVNAQSVANPSNLDVALSTRASETTVSDIKTQTDKLTFDSSNNLLVGINADSVGLAKSSQFPSSLTSSGNFKIAIEEDSTNILKEGGNVNIANYPSWLTSSTKTTDDLYTRLSSILNKLDVNLSTRASETTLSGVKVQTDKLKFDSNNNLLVGIGVDNVGLAKDSTVSGIKGSGGKTLTDLYNKLGSIGGTVSVSNMPTDYVKSSQLPSSLTSSGNLKTAVVEDSVGIARDSTLSSQLPRRMYGYDGSSWVPLKTTSDGKVVAWLG